MDQPDRSEHHQGELCQISKVSPTSHLTLIDWAKEESPTVEYNPAEHGDKADESIEKPAVRRNKQLLAKDNLLLRVPMKPINTKHL